MLHRNAPPERYRAGLFSINIVAAHSRQLAEQSALFGAEVSWKLDVQPHVQITVFVLPLEARHPAPFKTDYLSGLRAGIDLHRQVSGHRDNLHFAAENHRVE